MASPQPERAEHYFTPGPGAPSAPSEVELALPEGRLVRLRTDRGVFSPDRVDPGTRALLAEPAPLPSSRVLVDLGAGYGPIAVTLALRAPHAKVWAVEVNERARDLCRANAIAAGVDGQVTVIAPEGWPSELTVDELWSNPPIRIGKAALHDLLTTWLDRLRPGSGRARLVVHKHLGADSLARWLGEQGWPTERSGSHGGYRILAVEARS